MTTTLVGRYRGNAFPALQSPRGALEHDPAAHRGGRLAGEPTHLTGEVELRRVAAARHLGDVGVGAVDDRVEQLAQPVAAS